MEKIIEEINKLRIRYKDIPNKYNERFLYNLMNSITESELLANHPSATNLLNDLRNSIEKEKILLENTKNSINDDKNNFIFSVFNASYFPELKIEACLYDNLVIHPCLKEKYKSKVRAVNLKQATDGFKSRVVVALFPENHIDGVQLESDSIFYFINKFVDRFFKITHKMLSPVMGNDFFLALSNATINVILDACIYWVCLHEYHHRQGFLPIPKYLKIKSLKPLAGLEEMRVDVLSIIACIEDSDLPRKQAEFTAKFILAERLLRYAIEGGIKPNYDAIASQLLFNFLKRYEGLVIQDMKIILTKKWYSTLKKLALEIENIEAHISHKSETQVQQELLDFTKQYTNFNEETQDFNHIPYFKEIKYLYHL